MKQNRIDRIMKELEAMGVSQMLIVDPMSIYYLTGVYNDPHERFYGLLLKKDGNHIYFLNKLFSIHEEVGAEKVWYSDTDPAMEIVAQYLDKDAPLGVDKDLKARFLLPLMEQKAASAFLNTSLAVTAIYDVLKAKVNDATKLALLANFDTVLSVGLLDHAAALREKQAAEKAAAEEAKRAAAEAEAAAAAADPFVAEILVAIEARKAAKKAKNFAEADRIRDELAAKGVTLTDTAQGTTYTIN